jgi:hypothetical protein
VRNIDPFDPDGWPSTVGPTAGEKSHTRQNHYLKGRVPWPWLVKAGRLPGKALAVGLMLWQRRKRFGQRVVRFSLARARAEGIPVMTAQRAIRALEAAGLVRVNRKPGRALKVTILDTAGSGGPASVAPGND